MTASAKPPFRRIVQAFLVAAALALILNPEVRGLVLLTNALGFEVIAILLALQARTLLDLIAPEVHPLALVCKLASRFGYMALAAYPKAALCPLFNRLLCPAAITISYGLRCQPSNNRWRGP